MRYLKTIVKKLLTEKGVELLIETKRALKRFSKKEKIVVNDLNSSSLKIIGNKKYHTFFGYYDLSPFNKKSNEVLYLKVHKNRPEEADIIVHDLDREEIKLVESSLAWNWQQGSRLRWYPKSNDEIFYNVFKNGSYGSEKANIRNKEKTFYEKPIYDIDPEGEYGLSLNFERLGEMRPGYGYQKRSKSISKALKDEGVFLVEMSSGESTLILKYEDIAKKLNISTPNFEKNYINHLSFSPSGTKYLFFWLTKVNNYHEAYLFVHDLNAKEIIPLETKRKVSHYVWLNDNCILCTAYDQNNECSYYKYYLNGNVELVNPTSLNFDGHPTVLSDNLILTDSYPDGDGFQKVLISDLQKDRSEVILEIYSRYKANAEKRTDLHPRINHAGKQICFDANVNGRRELFILKNESTSYCDYSL